jgi:hypothetical protein
MPNSINKMKKYVFLNQAGITLMAALGDCTATWHFADK